MYKQAKPTKSTNPIVLEDWWIYYIVCFIDLIFIWFLTVRIFRASCIQMYYNKKKLPSSMYKQAKPTKSTLFF
jgi:hypothetical protein